MLLLLIEVKCVRYFFSLFLWLCVRRNHHWDKINVLQIVFEEIYLG